MLNILDRLLKWCCGTLAALALFTLMWLTVIDVVGRKFDHPLAGGLELTEILMVVVIFAALPLVSWRSEHVVFDTLDAYTSDRFKRWQARLVHGVCAAMMGLTAYIMMMRAERFANYGDRTEHFHISIASVAQIMVFSLVLATVIHVILAVFQPQAAAHAEPDEQEMVRD